MEQKLNAMVNKQEMTEIQKTIKDNKRIRQRDLDKRKARKFTQLKYYPNQYQRKNQRTTQGTWKSNSKTQNISKRPTYSSVLKKKSQPNNARTQNINRSKDGNTFCISRSYSIRSNVNTQKE